MTTASQVSLSHKTGYTPSERVKSLRPVSECPNTFPGGSFTIEPGLKGRRLHNKKYYVPITVPAAYWSLSSPDSNPDYVKQRLDFPSHPLVLMPSCCWAVTLHIISKALLVFADGHLVKPLTINISVSHHIFK